MFLKDRIHLPYPWIKIKNESDELLYKLSIAEDEEEAELFLFRLYREGHEDLKLFNAKEKEEVCALLQMLLEDTERHKNLIAEMIGEIRGIFQEVPYEP